MQQNLLKKGETVEKEENKETVEKLTQNKELIQELAL